MRSSSRAARAALPAAASLLTEPVVHGWPVRATVLAAFPFGLYLDAAGVVLPVVTSDAVPLPTALLLAEPAGQVGWGAGPGATVWVGEGRVGLPHLDVVASRVWRPARVRRATTSSTGGRPLTRGLHPPGRRWTTRGSGSRHGGGGGGGRAWLADGIRYAVCAPDPEPHVRSLLGRGSGLTPSGDDALAGALLVAHALGGGGALAAAVRRRLGTTTAVSAALLTAAADGYAARPVVTLVDAAVSADGQELRRVLPSVLSIGHSSGRDLVTGVCAALEALGCADALSALLALLDQPSHAAPEPMPPAPSIPTGRSAA